MQTSIKYRYPADKRPRWFSLRSMIILTSTALVCVLFGLAYIYSWHRVESLSDIPEHELAVPLMTSDEYSAIEHVRPYVLEMKAGQGELCYIGTGHTRIPDDAQIDSIISHWERFKPTVALCESNLGFFIGGLRQGVAEFGEAGAVFALARRDDVPMYSLEPPYESEVAALLREWSPQEVAMFYVLRRFMSDRIGADPDQFEHIISEAIVKRTDVEGLRGSIRDFTHFDSLYHTFLPTLASLGEISEEVIWPGRNETFLNQIATRSSYLRDLHMVRLLTHFIESGERVFAVVGASHVVMQEPALRGLLQTEHLQAEQ